MSLSIDTTTKICCNIVVDFNNHMMNSIPELRLKFPDKTDEEILYRLLDRTIEVFEENNNSMWN